MQTANLFGLRDDVYRRPLETSLNRVGIETGWRVADIGAGNGDVSVALSQLVGATGRVYSVDIDPRRRNEVATKAAIHSQVVAVTQAVEELALPEKLDLAFCRFLLLGVRDPALAMAKMAAAVKPGGWVVAQEPITSAGRIGHTALSADAAEITAPDIGLDLPALLLAAGVELADCWAEAPVGIGPGPVTSYLEEITGVEVGGEVVMLPPLVTVVGRVGS